MDESSTLGWWIWWVGGLVGWWVELLERGVELLVREARRAAVMAAVPWAMMGDAPPERVGGWPWGRRKHKRGVVVIKRSQALNETSCT